MRCFGTERRHRAAVNYHRVGARDDDSSAGGFIANRCNRARIALRLRRNVGNDIRSMHRA